MIKFVVGRTGDQGSLEQPNSVCNSGFGFFSRILVASLNTSLPQSSSSNNIHLFNLSGQG